MSLFDNLSCSDSNSELDLDLYELQLVLNGRSDSDSEPSDHEPLSDVEASDIGAIPATGTESQPSKKPYFYTVGTRILALIRKRDGVPIHKITCKLGISKSAINKLQAKAISRGQSPDKVIEPYHVDDTLRSGRPKTSNAIIELILKTMLQNSTTRGWSCNRIASEVSETLGQPVSVSTVYRALKEHGYGVYKRTVKPGLIKEQIKERLDQCLEYKDWTLEDWKNVIWTDETSVQLGGVRGRRRCWRKKDEVYHDYVVIYQWKGFKVFIWWSCFLYNKKGLYYIQEEETAAEKKACKADITARNTARHNKDKEEQELAQLIYQLYVTRAQAGLQA